jgi:hypothetical protein
MIEVVVEFVSINICKFESKNPSIILNSLSWIVIGTTALWT